MGGDGAEGQGRFVLTGDTCVDPVSSAGLTNFGALRSQRGGGHDPGEGGTTPRWTGPSRTRHVLTLDKRVCSV